MKTVAGPPAAVFFRIFFLSTDTLSVRDFTQPMTNESNSTSVTPVFSCPFGEFKLQTRHYHPKSPLQAWNAADEMLLKHCADQTNAQPRVLLINDAAGALATCLHQWQPHSWNDSYCSRLALLQNLQRNGLPFDESTWIVSTEQPQGKYDLVLIKVPKTLSLLEYQLCRLRPHLHADTQIIGAAMVKHLSTSMIQCFERLIGPTRTSRAEKKARRIHARFDATLKGAAPEPIQYGIENTPLQLINYASVFSQQKLDIGTRILLENFPASCNESQGQQHIVDLGCGNGALGCYAAWKNPQAQISMVDESYLALKSAQQSIAASGLKNTFNLINADGLNHLPATADLILCNPPFHAGTHVDDNIANRMFRDARSQLAPGGEFVVVGNRHLDYHDHLKRYFDQVTLVGSNKKFVVLSARTKGH